MVLALMAPQVAVIVVVPAPTEVARPVFNPIVATPALKLVQLAVPVKLAVLRSL